MQEVSPLWVSAGLWFFGLCVISIGVVRGPTGFARYRDLRMSEARLETTLEQLRGEARSLESEIQRITSSPAYARKILRDKFHVIGDNERIVFFSDTHEERHNAQGGVGP